MAASAWATAGIVTFPFLFFVSAPYGKLGRDGWGPRIDGRLGWCLQELPSPLALLYGIYTSNAASSADSCGAWMSTWKDGAPSMVLVAVALWCAHYANRAVWYPLTRHMSHGTMAGVLPGLARTMVNPSTIAWSNMFMPSRRQAACWLGSGPMSGRSKTYSRIRSRQMRIVG